MKKFLILLIIPFLSFGQEHWSHVSYVKVNINPDETLNMRSEPTEKSKIVTKLNHGEELYITGNWTGKWIEVWKGGPTMFEDFPVIKGWAHIDFLIAPNFNSSILGDAELIIEENDFDGGISITQCAKKKLIIAEVCNLNGNRVKLKYNEETKTYFYNDLIIQEILIKNESPLKFDGYLIINYKAKKEFIFIKCESLGC